MVDEKKGRGSDGMAFKKFFADWDCITCARWLFTAELVSLFVSTSLTSAIEVLLFGCVLLCMGRFRARIVFSIRQPMVVMTLAFIGVLCLGLFYGPAATSEKLAVLKGWRKLLLLPLAAVLFDDVRWKQRLTWAMIGIATFYMLRSYWGLLGHGSTIAVHNHATQGMFFAVAAFAAIVFAFSESVRRGFLPQWLLLLGGIFLVVNAIFVTSGRSGYLALFVLSVVAPFVLLRGRFRIALAASVPLAFLLLLAFSPVARERIDMGIGEVQNYKQAEEYSSMGIRMVMWKNTLQIIKERPLFGYGLGGLKEAYREQVAGVEGWQGIVVDDPHNQYLKIATEHGIVGLLVFLGLIGSLSCQNVPQPYRLLGLGVLFAWCATSLFNGHFNTSAEGRFFMLWAGAQLAMGSGSVWPEGG
jgi:O-antigen ligase